MLNVGFDTMIEVLSQPVTVSVAPCLQVGVGGAPRADRARTPPPTSQPCCPACLVLPPGSVAAAAPAAQRARSVAGRTSTPTAETLLLQALWDSKHKLQTEWRQGAARQAQLVLRKSREVEELCTSQQVGRGRGGAAGGRAGGAGGHALVRVVSHAFLSGPACMDAAGARCQAACKASRGRTVTVAPLWLPAAGAGATGQAA